VVGRKVHFTEKKSVERGDNWIRRKAILESSEVLYVAG